MTGSPIITNEEREFEKEKKKKPRALWMNQDEISRRTLANIKTQITYKSQTENTLDIKKKSTHHC